jgi:hypothetical protein
MRSVCTDRRLLFNWRGISLFYVSYLDMMLSYTYAFDSLLRFDSLKKIVNTEVN